MESNTVSVSSLLHIEVHADRNHPGSTRSSPTMENYFNFESLHVFLLGMGESKSSSILLRKSIA
jgi:hypothetical protein